MATVETLPNGLSVLTFNFPHLQSVSTVLAVGAGARYETKQQSGISHFLEHMAFKGSKRFPSAALINGLVEGSGSLNNAFTAYEYTGYWTKSSTAKLELMCDILSSMIKAPLFDETQVERERKVVIEEIRRTKDSPENLANILYQGLQFGDHPLGRSVGGAESTIKSLTSNDLSGYIDSLYSPKQMVLCFAGKLPRNIHKLAERYFGDLPERSTKSFEPYQNTPQIEPKVAIRKKATAQASIVLGVQGYSGSDQKEYATLVLGTILGTGMSSRLFTEIRGNRALAYDISAGHDAYLDTGFFSCAAGINLENLIEGVKAIRLEFDKIATKRVLPPELVKAKEIIRGRTALKLESPGYIATSAAIGMVLTRELKTFEEEMQKIDDVSPNDILDVAQDLFRGERFNLQIVGSVKQKDPFLEVLGA